MSIPTNKDEFESSHYENGCEFCGTKFPGLGKYFGLTHAHIISRAHGPEHRWNVFILCRNCHHLFDTLIKPRLLAALRIAGTGFFDSPNNPGEPPFIVAQNWKDIIERLHGNLDSSLRLPRVNTTQKLWSTRSKKPSAGKPTPAKSKPKSPPTPPPQKLSP